MSSRNTKNKKIYKLKKEHPQLQKGNANWCKRWNEFLNLHAKDPQTVQMRKTTLI